MVIGTLVMLTESHAGYAARTTGKVVDRTKEGRKITAYAIRILSGVGNADILVIGAEHVSKIG